MEDYLVYIDNECLSQDIDDIDLFGEQMIEESEETDILFN